MTNRSDNSSNDKSLIGNSFNVKSISIREGGEEENDMERHSAISVIS